MLHTYQIPFNTLYEQNTIKDDRPYVSCQIGHFIVVATEIFSSVLILAEQE